MTINTRTSLFSAIFRKLGKVNSTEIFYNITEFLPTFSSILAKKLRLSNKQSLESLIPQQSQIHTFPQLFHKIVCTEFGVFYSGYLFQKTGSKRAVMVRNHVKSMLFWLTSEQHYAFSVLLDRIVLITYQPVCTYPDP